MKTHSPLASMFAGATGSMLAVAALLLLPHAAAAQGRPDAAQRGAERPQAPNHSGWSINFTPVLIFPSGGYHFGGGVDPELKYTFDLGTARLSLGGRVGTYYAKDQLGAMAMPTLRVMVPVGPVEPYASVGLGYGWLPGDRHDGLATMGRLGFVYRFSERLAIGVEATYQQLDGSRLQFPSFGSMMSFDL